MYRVIIETDNEQHLIHDDTTNDTRFLDDEILYGINSFDSLTFEILPDNPAFEYVKPFRTRIFVRDMVHGKDIFRGQVVSKEESYETDESLTYKYICASDLSYLQDTIQPYAKIQNTTPAQFFSYLIEKHNEMVKEEFKKFTVGVVDVTNSTDNVYRYVDDTATTWETIKDKLIDRLGGEIVVRNEYGVNYIDYLVEAGEHLDTTVEIRKNMLSFNRTIDPTSVITVVKPRGKRAESTDADYNASQPRLTIASVNDGKDYLLASEAIINEFGYREGSIVYDDINDPNILKTRGEQFLASQKVALVQYKIDAIDLSLFGIDRYALDVCNYYPVLNGDMNAYENLRIVGKRMSITNFQNFSVTFGDKNKTMTQYQNDMNRQVRIAVTLQDELSNVIQENAILSAQFYETKTTTIPSIESTIGDLQKALSLLQNPYASGRYFPVDFTLPGINFFKRSLHSANTLEYEMTYGERSSGFHSGYDIGSNGNAGYAVYATTSGTVRWSGFKDGGIGNCIYIEHSSDGYWSNYMHLASMLVAVGDTVVAGQQIGVMGATGGDYEIHLHYELSPDGVFHSNGNTLDPEAYLGITDDYRTTLANPGA